MRTRLRPALTSEELAKVYPTPHQHEQWAEHRIRVALTCPIAQSVPATTAADLSCGDGTILRSLVGVECYYGDYSTGWALTGLIEDTIWRIPNVDLFICTETLEHLDDPDTTLKAIRAKTHHLVLSTPVDAWGDVNPEHYWAWSRDDVEVMLREAGFSPDFYVAVDFTRSAENTYCFGIWRCR